MRQRQFLDLFRRHIGRRTDPAHLRGLLALDHRRAEVRDLDVALAANEDVGGLDVAMDDALVLRVFQRLAAFVDDLRDAPQREQVIHLAVFFQRLALDVFHHHVILVALDHRVVDLHDVRVRELAGECSLGDQLFAEGLADRAVLHHIVIEQLDRHLLIVERIERKVDGAGRTVPEFLDDLIFTDGFHAQALLYKARILRVTRQPVQQPQSIQGITAPQEQNGSGAIITSMQKILLSALLSLPLLACADGLPDLGDVSQTMVSPQMERQIGEQSMLQIRASNSYLDDPELTDYINRLGDRLVANSSEPSQPFEFFVINDNAINAFALPGGFIGVNTGLIQLTQNESELASVLSHEISHVTQHHLARMVSGQKYDSLAAMATMAVAILAARNNPQAASAAIVGAQGGVMQRQLDFTREHEKEADRIGLGILDKSGFDTRAMPAFFDRMQKATQILDSNTTPSYLRTHPLTTERVADVDNRVQQIPFHLVPDSLDFQLMRARLNALQKTPAGRGGLLQLRPGRTALRQPRRTTLRAGAGAAAQQAGMRSPHRNSTRCTNKRRTTPPSKRWPDRSNAWTSRTRTYWPSTAKR